MKATNDQLTESYNRLGNIWLVAQEFGMCGQSVHERLTKLGVMKTDAWTEAEIAMLSRFYTERIFTGRGEFNLEEFSKRMGRDKSNVSRKARELGLTNMHRRLSKDSRDHMSEKMVRWHQENEHPRGMLGKKQTEEAITKITSNEVLKAKHAKGMLVTPRNNCSWKGGNRIIGGKEKYYRSKWEANYARYLQHLKENGSIKDWEHEPKTFWFDGITRGCRMYLPDFHVIPLNGKDYFVEVKGWMDQRSQTKLDRMKKYYPEVDVYLVEKKKMKEVEKSAKHLIPEWEN